MSLFVKNEPVKIFVYTHVLSIFIKNILPCINKSCIVYCGNSDHPFNEEYLCLLNNDFIVELNEGFLKQIIHGTG